MLKFIKKIREKNAEIWTGPKDVWVDASPIVEREFALKDFLRMRSFLSADVEFVHSPESKLNITAQSGMIDKLKLNVIENCLHIGSESFLSKDPIRITVYAPEVNHIHVSGSGRFLMRNHQSERFSLYLQGSGSAQLSGKSGTARLAVVGEATLDASELLVDTADLELRGSGTMRVKTVKATGSIFGTGIMELSGTHDIQCVGGGRVITRK